MIDEIMVKSYCKEDISLIENYNLAVSDKENSWVCHHKDEIKILPSGIIVVRTRKDLIENDRYYGCYANELVFMTRKDHLNMHRKFWSEETQSKLLKSKQGRSNPKARKTFCEFGEKFKAHFGINQFENPKLYNRERMWYVRHNNICRWEIL